jgi:hypothetical protein
MRPAPIRFFALFWILVGVGFQSGAQTCPEEGVNESLYGEDAWYGYIYDGLNSFGSNFLGTKNEATTVFNETFASGQTDGNCPLTLSTFSVRFKNRATLSCGLHTFTITSNNIARLSIDGGSTFLINITSGTGNASVHLTGGTYDLVLEYVHNTGSPQIGFDFNAVVGDYAGQVSGDQVICDNSPDPAAFATLSPARFCSGSPASYQWEVNYNGGGYADIIGATGATYNPPAGLAAGNYLYRRRATDGTTTVTSNEISVVVDIPEGDQTSFGTTLWMAYAYEGADNYSSGSYLGYFEENASFTEDFDAVAMNGCDLPAEGFSVRFKRQESIGACGGYDFTIQVQGGGARLYVDGELVIDGYTSVSSLTTYSANILLAAGVHQFILEYYSDTGTNYLEFNQNASGITGGGGVIGTDQTACGAPYDPVAFTSIKDAEFCSGAAITYQWQRAPTASGVWAPIPGAESATFDEGALAAGTYFYRRAATVGGTTVYSNVIRVDVLEPAGNPNDYGSDIWRAYAYDGADNFTPGSYLGYFEVASLNFSEDFSAVTMSGCELPEENFSVRFRREVTTLGCGGYNITLTGDDQVKLYLDNVQLTNGYTASYSGNIFLDGGSHTFDIEYYVVAGTKSVSFTITPTGATSSGGAIGYGQDVCSSALDPAPFQSLVDAGFCSPVGTLTYKWQRAVDPAGPWADLPSSNSPTYDPPAFTPAEEGTYYFRRVYTDSGTGTEVFSNALQVLVYAPKGDQTSFGDDQWIGYVYNDEANWTDNYRGFITEDTNFDETFCGSDCLSSTNGCPVRTTGFSVLFKNRADFGCGTYLITVGGDDGVRLIVDGETIPEFDKLTLHSYTTYSKIMYFDGLPDPIYGTPEVELELYYFEGAGDNRVSFSATFLGPGYAGTIGGDHYSCVTGIDPDELTSIEDATTCAGPITYRWQYSLDGIGWNDIPGANSPSYDPPGPLSITTYYRRQAIIDGYTLNSNVVAVEIDPPQGDEVTFGQNYWIGYVYDAYLEDEDHDRDPVDYRGYMIESTNFDQHFCGPSECRQAINGCDVEPEHFVIRYKNEMTLECGWYQITLGFNDGGRLFIDDVPEMGEWWMHGVYTELTKEVFLTGGTHQFVYDYLEGDFGNRVSFNIEFLRPGTPALIGNHQAICTAPYDPAPIIQFGAPTFPCNPASPVSYQWQVSTDQVNWSDIPSATNVSYDPPAGHTYTRHYRRKDTNGAGEVMYSNVVTLSYDPDPATTDGSEYGTAPDWIAHVYFGIQNFTNYRGSFIQPMVADAFDQSFCGPNCLFPIDGCDILTNSFTVQFKTQINLPPGEYTFTIGSAGAARLTISGGELVSPLLAVDDFINHQPYRERSNDTPITLLGGTYLLDLDYSEEFAANRVSFSYTFAPLPVTWHYFNGYYADGRSFLEWHTASEIDNQGFEVQHSTNGTHFATIGWVDGHGNSNEPHKYEFVHDQPVLGWNYYRLKQIDFDGKFEYSRLIPVFADDLPRVEIFPNPLDPQRDRLFLSRVNTDQPIHVTLTNMMGQDPLELAQDPLMPSSFIVPERLAPGLYHVRIRMGDAVHTRKLVIE